MEALITTNVSVPTSLGITSAPCIAMDGVWIGSLGNGLSGETVLFYTITFIVLLVLVITLAALIRCEIRGEGGESEGGRSTSSHSSPPP